MRAQRKARSKNTRRRGAAAVEMAVTLPVLILFFFAQFELVRLNNIRNTVYMAAYEGAREGLIPGATVADIEAKVDNMVGTVGAINHTTTVSPTTIEADTERVSVTVTVPLDDNAWTVPLYAPGKTITATVELVREQDDTAYVSN